jgi:hypothetical protein
MLITDQVATAPCTDCVQARRPTFEAKPTLMVGFVTKSQMSQKSQMTFGTTTAAWPPGRQGGLLRSRFRRQRRSSFALRTRSAPHCF